MRGADMLIVVREVQIPLLAALLIGGCVAKAHQAFTRSAPGTEADPTAMFPLRLRGLATVGMSATELALGCGLLATAGRAGAGALALGFRSATALLFCIAAAALQELGARRPTAGCGCFGDLSGTPVGRRTITRALLLCAAAFATIGLPPLHMPGSPAQAGLVLVVTAAELAAIASLSPEVGVVLVRLGRAEPCEVRQVPLGKTMNALHASGAWRRYCPYVISAEPSDVWREGCWRFLVFPAVLASRRVDLVFAVYLMGRRAQVRSGFLDADVALPSAPHRGSHRYASLGKYRKNSIIENKSDISERRAASQFSPATSASGTRPSATASATQADCERRNLPKCGTVNAIRPRSEL